MNGVCAKRRHIKGLGWLFVRTAKAERSLALSFPPGKAVSRNGCELDRDAEKQSERRVDTCLQVHKESEPRAYQWQVFF